MQAPLAAAWQEDHVLATDCAHHARLFFGSADLGLDSAVPGTFTLTPSPAMREALEKDYEAMAGMIFGDVPPLDAVLHSAEHCDVDVFGKARDQAEGLGERSAALEQQARATSFQAVEQRI